jgi:hypothetical protein
MDVDMEGGERSMSIPEIELFETGNIPRRNDASARHFGWH